MRYRIIYSDESGHFKSKTLATVLHGELIRYIENFDDRGDSLALLEFPNENYDYAEYLLSHDKSVISYRNTKYV